MEYFDLLFYKFLKGVQSKGRINTNFPAYVNGAEQLLPVNTSAPATTPFLGDIRYSDGYRNNQYFTYRESPTSVDGLAKIKSIKGNTLVWNQLYPNPTTFPSSASFGFNNGQTFYQNHKYLFNLKGNLINASADNIALWFYGRSNNASAFTNRILIGFTSAIWTCTATATSNGTVSTSAENNVWIYFANRSNANITSLNVIDLTQMFGAGNEPTTVDEFTSLFPLPYYAYNSGSLLSFNGNGIKTVEFNLFNPTSETFNGYLRTITSNDVRWTYEADSRSVAMKCFPNTTYCVYTNGLTPSILRVCSIAEELPSGADWDIQCEKQFVNSTTGMTIFTTGANAKYLIVQSNRATFDTIKANLCISVSSDKNGTYEPYTENTTNLPTETYFPTGMKSVGTVYDELKPSKAITRIGVITLDGTQNIAISNWRPTSTSVGVLFPANMINTVRPQYGGQVGNLVSVTQVGSYNNAYNGDYDLMVAIVNSGGNYSLAIRLPDASLTTDALVNAYLAQHPITVYYELATPTEEDVSEEAVLSTYNKALSTILGKTVSVNNPQEAIDIITKGE